MSFDRLATDFYPIDTTFFVKSELPLLFVYHLLRTVPFVDSHAAVPGLARDQAYAIEIELPSEEAIAAFDEFVRPMFELRENLLAQAQRLSTVMHLLRPALVSGELDVSTLEAGFSVR